MWCQDPGLRSKNNLFLPPSSLPITLNLPLTAILLPYEPWRGCVGWWVPRVPGAQQSSVSVEHRGELGSRGTG